MAKSEKDWIIAQNRDHVIREIKYLMNKKGLTERKVYSRVTLSIKQYLRQHSHKVLWGVLYRWIAPSKKDLKQITVCDPPKVSNESPARMS